MWRVINKDYIDNIDFFNIVFEVFKHNKLVDILMVKRLSEALRNKYEEVLSYLYDSVQNLNGNILEAMKQLYLEFDEKVKPIIEVIVNYSKNGANSKRKIRNGRNN